MMLLKSYNLDPHKLPRWRSDSFRPSVLLGLLNLEKKYNKATLFFFNFLLQALSTLNTFPAQLFFLPRRRPFVGIQFHFAHANVFGCHFNKLIFSNKFYRLIQGKHTRRA